MGNKMRLLEAVDVLRALRLDTGLPLSKLASQLHPEQTGFPPFGQLAL